MDGAILYSVDVVVEVWVELGKNKCWVQRISFWKPFGLTMKEKYSMVKCHQGSSLLLGIIPEIQLEISVKNKVNNINRGNISRTHAARTDDTMSRLNTMRSNPNYFELLLLYVFYCYCCWHSSFCCRYSYCCVWLLSTHVNLTFLEATVVVLFLVLIVVNVVVVVIIIYCLYSYFV